MSAERVQEEIETLEAIYLNDIIISYSDRGRPNMVTLKIFPSTADDSTKQYVCLTLEIKLPLQYPDVQPIIAIRTPRGLDDCIITHLYRSLEQKCQELMGQPMIFELVEMVKEALTSCNLPSCHCAICLYGFCEGDAFKKTQCYHYFHSYCLTLHWKHTEKQFYEEQESLPAWQRSTKGCRVGCPICREVLTCDIKELEKASPPQELVQAQEFQMTKDLQYLQAKMKGLYTYQKRKGGIIDMDETKTLLIASPRPNSSQLDSSSSFPEIGNANELFTQKTTNSNS